MLKNKILTTSNIIMLQVLRSTSSHLIAVSRNQRVGFARAFSSSTTTAMKATADLCDEFGDELQYVDGGYLRDYGGRIHFHGVITTISCLEDNTLVKQVVQENGAGKVLVVHGGGSVKRALVGDQIAKAAMDNGWAGFVVNGCIRDAAEVKTLDIGLKAIGTIPRKTEKLNSGLRDIPVTFGGVTFVPGEYLVADIDGVVVSKKEIK